MLNLAHEPETQRDASAVDTAATKLRTAILTGKHAAGSTLAGERELSEQLGVSRLTLRAALATLAATGLISVRQGSGYTVRDVRETGGSDLLPGLLELAAARGEREEVVADLLRLRRHLAAAVLDAIAERHPAAAARKAVHAAVDAFAAAVATRKLEAIAAADLEVVRALLDVTGSMVLRVCLNPIVALVTNDARLRAAMYAEPTTNIAGWRTLLAWLDRPTAAAIPVLVNVLAERDRTTLRRLRSR